ncbi:MFS transporter [Novosphingobium fuchskuhlense]|uniref:MFS transporter n=1 Tax=Novosphingobium fuchskuhlense TaxID=1117702 RepID=UPI000B25EE1E|nr:MFS transporter [Novosphingobium fuchskuhlense]
MSTVDQPKAGAGSLPLLLVLVFLNIAGFSLILPLLPFYGHAFGAGPFAIACLFAAYSLGNIAGEIFWGRRSDLTGRRPVLVLTTACAAVTYIAFAFSQNLETALVLRVVGGFFGGTLGVVQGVIADITPPRDRAKVMGFFGAAFNFGFAVGPAIGGLLASPEQGLAGFHLPIFAAAALAAGASLWAWQFLAETRQPGPARTPPRYGEAVSFVSTSPLLWRLLLISWCGIAIFASTEAIFGLWTERAFGWTTHEVGLTFLAVGGVGLLVQTLGIGPLVKRFGEAKVIVGGLILLCAAVGLQPVFHAPVATVCLMALMMAGHSLAFPNAGALISRNTPPERQGSVMGLSMASNASSRIIAPPLFGLVFGLSADAPFLLGAVIIVLVVPVALAVVKLTAPRPATA